MGHSPRNKWPTRQRKEMPPKRLGSASITCHCVALRKDTPRGYCSTLRPMLCPVRHAFSRAGGGAMNTQPSGKILRPRDTALRLLWMKPPAQPLPLPPEAKAPAIKDWRNFTCTIDEVDHYFPDDGNVSVLLGEKSHGLADADLDCWEAILAAPFYLPPTGMVFGRESKPRSHYGYRLTSLEGAQELKFSDVSMTPERRARGQKAMLCELRLTGQTVMPGSINVADGHRERVRYEADGEGDPAPITFQVFKWALSHIASAALMARLWVEGYRHQFALPLAGFLFYGGMPLEDAETFMRAVCAAAREKEDEIENRVQAVRDTYRNALAGKHVTGGATLEDLVGSGVISKLRVWLDLKKQSLDARVYGPDGLPLAHDGDAQRFMLKYLGQVLYCALERQWYIYNGIVWEADRRGRVRELAKACAVEFREQLADTLKVNQMAFGNGGVGTLRECTDWAKSMGNDGHITAMLNSAGSLDQIAVVPEQFDADDRLFNVLDVTLVLDRDSGRVTARPHAPEDLLTMVAAGHYRPDATHLLFDEYHQLFFPEDDRWLFLQEVAGYTLSGIQKRHSLHLLGPTNAGKSMTHSLFAKALGTYASSLEYTSLMKNPHKGGDTPRSDLWRIRKKRLVTVSEIPPDAHFDIALFKALLGGDSVPFRTLYDKSGGEPVDWTLMLWLSGNRPYGPPPNDTASYDRLLPLRCDHQIAPEARDLAKQLATIDPSITGDAVLAFMLKGFERLYGEKRGRLIPPEVVKEARDALANDLDEWNTTIRDLFEFTGDERDGVLKSEAWDYARMTAGITRNLRKAQEAFEESLTRRGALSTKSNARFKNKRCWLGVRWTAEFAETWKPTPPDW